jgi:hypothetical protein
MILGIPGVALHEAACYTALHWKHGGITGCKEVQFCMLHAALSTQIRLYGADLRLAGWPLTLLQGASLSA